MAPKRKAADLKLKSIWDEEQVTSIVKHKKHVQRIHQYLYKNPETTSISEIPFKEWSIPRIASEQLKSDFVLSTSRIVERFESSRGDTTKLLVELQDGHRVETVVMRHRSNKDGQLVQGRSTVCVSSQIGCQMGCRFCATGTLGIIGDLTSAEILEQFVFANGISRLRNVVFMGMGEPLNNYDNVKRSIDTMVDVRRFGLSPRHVTVSTVGVLKNMHRLTDEMPTVSLALSLHAPNQEVRVKIVPAATAHKIDKLLAAMDNHIARNVEGSLTGSRPGSRPQNKQKVVIIGDDDEIESQQQQVPVSEEKAILPPSSCDDATTTATTAASVTTATAAEDADAAESEKSSKNNNEITPTIDNISKNNDCSNDSVAVAEGKLSASMERWNVMIEYILIQDINNLEEHAHELGRLLSASELRRKHVILNLIPYNPTEVAEDYKPPTPDSVDTFARICSSYDVFTKVRREMGQDVAAACGQLALVKPGPASGVDVDSDKGVDGAVIADIEDSAARSSNGRSQKKASLVSVSVPASSSSSSASFSKNQREGQEEKGSKVGIVNSTAIIPANRSLVWMAVVGAAAVAVLSAAAIVALRQRLR